jgi:hypothetical protein
MKSPADSQPSPLSRGRASTISPPASSTTPIVVCCTTPTCSMASGVSAQIAA